MLGRSPFDTDLFAGEEVTEITSRAQRLVLGSPFVAETIEFQERPVTTDLPQLNRCETSITQAVDASPLVTFQWPGRGIAPIGYLYGMALTYARVLCKLHAQDPSALLMAEPATRLETDALNNYRPASGSQVDNLRHLFVLLTGLGMRESTGRYCVGRDQTVSPIPSVRDQEAGLFQMSYSVGVGSPNFPDLRLHYDQLALRPYDGYEAIFALGIPRPCRRTELTGFGRGRAGAFREFCVRQPALCAEVAALALRQRARHWGPIRGGTVTLSPDCDALLLSVQQIVESERCCEVNSFTYPLGQRNDPLQAQELTRAPNRSTYLIEKEEPGELLEEGDPASGWRAPSASAARESWEEAETDIIDAGAYGRNNEVGASEPWTDDESEETDFEGEDSEPNYELSEKEEKQAKDQKEVRRLNRYKPKKQDTLVIDTVEFDTGLSHFKNYADPKTPHNNKLPKARRYLGTRARGRRSR